MLVLSRKPGQRVMIDDHIEVVVLDSRGDRVRLGIVAPDEIRIHREEIYERIRHENAALGRSGKERRARAS